MSMSKQKIFEKVVTHLIKQGVRSVNDYNVCMYRGPYGNKCAVGCLIPDKMYSAKMEGNNIFGLISEFKNILPKYIIDNKEFLMTLQDLHDEKNNWNKNGLKSYVIEGFTKRHNLSIDFLKGI